ncbi:MAG: dephospho-CoA kinase [Stappiaceae bacterium]
MIVAGLTGSIGMGKSTTAAMFRRLGCPVYDADATVHDLYKGEAVATIEAAFPGTTKNGQVDRKLLSARVLNDAVAMKLLESIVHPLVRKSEQAFLERARAEGQQVVVLDIPLLFETGGENRVDAVIVVTASPELQRERVMAREGMTEEMFSAIVAKQVPDSEKRERAHFLVHTDHGIEAAERQVADILRELIGMTGKT